MTPDGDRCRSRESSDDDWVSDTERRFSGIRGHYYVIADIYVGPGLAVNNWPSIEDQVGSYRDAAPTQHGPPESAQ